MRNRRTEEDFTAKPQLTMFSTLTFSTIFHALAMHIAYNTFVLRLELGSFSAQACLIMILSMREGAGWAGDSEVC